MKLFTHMHKYIYIYSYVRHGWPNGWSKLAALFLREPVAMGILRGNIGSKKLTFLKFHGPWFNTNIVEHKPVPHCIQAQCRLSIFHLCIGPGEKQRVYSGQPLLQTESTISSILNTKRLTCEKLKIYNPWIILQSVAIPLKQLGFLFQK